MLADAEEPIGRTVKEACEANVIETIKKQKHVPIVTDGWTDVNSYSIMNFIVVAPGMPSLFWSSIVTGAQAYTAGYIEREIKRLIDEV